MNYDKFDEDTRDLLNRIQHGQATETVLGYDDGYYADYLRIDYDGKDSINVEFTVASYQGTYSEEGELTVSEFFDLINNRLFGNPGAQYTIMQKVNKSFIKPSLKEYNDEFVYSGFLIVTSDS